MMTRPRWLLALLFALAVAAVFALLGQWQLSRALASGEVVHRSTEVVRPLERIVKPGGPVPQTATGQMVSVAGHFVPGDEQIVEGRLEKGAQGWWVVSHFVTDDPGASIPVARGWAASRDRADAARRELAENRSADTAVVTGRFLPSEAPVVPKEGADPHSMSTVSVAALVNVWSGYSSQGVYAGYIVDQASAAGLQPIYSPAPEQDVALNWLNIFYAVEWVIFAGFAVFLWFRLVKDAVEREEDLAEQASADAVQADAAPRPGT